MLGKPKPCKYCARTAHSSLMCFAKPRKSLHKIGPVTRQWIATRKEWVKLNPPDKDGTWRCYLALPDCLGRITYEQLTLDHVKPRSTHPELRNELSNLKPACLPCNTLKGSRELEKL